MNYKQTIKIAMLAATATAFITACSKDDEVKTLSDSSAVVKEVSLTPTTDSIFYNINTNLVDTKANSLFSFAGKFYNLDITPTDSANYTFGYFTSSLTDVDDITVSVLDTAQINHAKTLTLRMLNFAAYTNVENTWYDYNFTTHTLSPQEGRYAILYKVPNKGSYTNTTDVAYVLQLSSITQSGRTVSGFTVKSISFTK